MKGTLSLVGKDTENTRPNPAAECGHSPHLNFGDNLGWAYPDLHKQSVRLPLRRIFDSRRSLRLVLKPKFIGSAEGSAGFAKFDETLQGQTTVTLTRLPAR